MSHGCYHSEEGSILLEDLDGDSESYSDPEDCDLGKSCDDEWDESSSISSFLIYADLSAECDISVLEEPDDELSYDSTVNDDFSEVTIESDDEHLYSSLTTEIEKDQMQQCCDEEAVRNSIQSAQCETEEQFGPRRPFVAKSESKRSLVMAKVLGLESSVRELGKQLRKFSECE
jgi:hypothetical protein